MFVQTRYASPIDIYTPRKLEEILKKKKEKKKEKKERESERERREKEGKEGKKKIRHEGGGALSGFCFAMSCLMSYASRFNVFHYKLLI